MASTSRGAQLTEQQRLAQQQVRNGFLTEFLAMWALLDSARLDATAPGWVSAVVPLIARYRLRSARVATDYFAAFQAVEAPSSPTRPRIPTPAPTAAPAPASPGRSAPTPRSSARTSTPSRGASSPAPTGEQGGRADTSPASGSSRRDAPIIAPRDRRVRLDLDESAFAPRDQRRARIEIPDIDWAQSDRAARVSMTVTGPVSQKSKAARGKPLQVARDESFVEASGAAARHVLTGGRQSLLRLAQDDMQVRGWVRVTDGDPCAFCAMLASRGVVFKEDSFARSDPRWEGPGTVKVHDHCACTIEMVYTSDTVLPGRAAEFQKLWNDNIRGKYSGQDARNAWRRLYEQQQRDARRSNVA